MSQRTRKSLIAAAAAAASPSTPQRATRNKSLAEAPTTTPQKATDTPQRLTRKSLAQVEAATEVKTTPTRRTRTSSISSVLSDVSEIVSESGRVTRRSTRLSGIKLDEPVELPPTRKRTSSVSSVTSETPSQTTKTTRKSLLSKDVPHEDSPFKVTSTRKSRKLSLTTVDETEVEDKDKEKTPTKLNTEDLEEITFSSEDEEVVKKVPNRGRKSMLPGRNELNTIDEDEADESEVVPVEVKEVKSKSPKTEEVKSQKSPKKELLQKHINAVKTPEAKKSPSVLVNRIDSKDVSPNLVLDKLVLPDEAKSTTPKDKRKSNENKKQTPKLTPKPQIEKTPENAQPQNKKETPKTVPEPESMTSANRKRKSTEKLNVGGTPKKSPENLKNAQKEINFEEIVLEDDDVVMEDVAAETMDTSKTPKQTPKKKVSFSNSKESEDPKNTEVVELDQAEDKENDENSAPVVASQETPKSPKRKRETLEERLERIRLGIRLGNAKLCLDGKRKKKSKFTKRKHRSEKDKLRSKERHLKKILAKQNETTDTIKKSIVITETPKTVTSQTPSDNSNKDEEINEKLSENEQKRLLRIMEKKQIKREKWMKHLAKLKAETEIRKREQKALDKAERRSLSQQEAKEIQNKTTNIVKKKQKKRKGGNKTEGEGKKAEDGVNISLSDIVARLDEMTQPTNKILTESNDDNNTDEPTRGKAKSGRWWKDSKDKFSTMVKTPGLRRPHSEKEKLRADIKHNKEMTRNILEAQAQAKEEHRQRRAENIKRREENAKKAEIVQVIKNPAKLKRMRKKQLRLIEKRDTLPIIEKKKNAAAAAES